MVYYYAYIDSNYIVQAVYAMPSPISGNSYIVLDSYDASLVGKRYNPDTGLFENVTWYYYAQLDDRDIVTQIISNPDEPLTAANDLISISSNDTTLIGKWYNRTLQEFQNAPIHVLAELSTDEINVGTADKWLTTEISDINEAIADLETAVDGKAATSHVHAAATTTAAGFMSAADKTKLDGISGTGLDGADGTDGADGASAYEIAVENGYTGTETQWLASLVGTAGQNGVDGTDGADGTTLVVGTTTTGDAGTNASVSGVLNSETNTMTLNFTIPKGETGAAGSGGSDTAAEVLTKIKTVDGTGSGLDADTLDGIEAEGFAAANHTHSGYAATTHNHDTAYSAINHTHSNYAAATHNHDEDYADISHTHSQYLTSAALDDYATTSAMNTALSGKSDTTHTHTGYAAANHTHSNYATVSDMETLADTVDGKAAANHTHTQYAGTSHTHAQSDVTGLSTALAGKSNTDHTHSAYATTAALSTLSTAVDGKASTNHTHTQYAATSHAHEISDVTGLSTALSGKADSSHTHTGYASSNHTHTASDVGAASSSHTHTLSSLGAAASNHTHSEYASSSHTHTSFSSAIDVTGAIKSNGAQVAYNSGTMSTLGSNNYPTVIAGTEATINGTKVYAPNIYPRGTGTFTLGAQSNRWTTIYSVNALNVSSDERLKENINDVDAQACADFINALQVKSFNFIGTEDKQNIGIIAQQLIEANPELSKYFVELGDNGFYGVTTSDLVFPLISAVQELSKRVNALENK